MKTLRLHLHTWGAKLRRQEGMFEVTTVDRKGKTIQTRTYSAERVRSVQLNEGTTISADAVQLALRHDVDLIFQTRHGVPIGRVTSPELGSTARVRRGQLLLASDARGLARSRDWICAKLTAQAALLDTLRTAKRSKSLRTRLHEAEKQLRKTTRQLTELPIERADEATRQRLRGLEGQAGRAYFTALGRVPPRAFRFERRSRRPATDAFNAALNYGYGMLYVAVETRLLRAGLSPYIGFLHRDGYRFKSLVYDFIEPFRPAVDGVIVGLFGAKTLKEAHFSPETEAPGIRIDRMGRQLIADAVDHHLFATKRRHRDRKQTPEQIMQLEAHALATYCAACAPEGD